MMNLAMYYLLSAYVMVCRLYRCIQNPLEELYTATTIGESSPHRQVKLFRQPRCKSACHMFVMYMKADKQLSLCIYV